MPISYRIYTIGRGGHFLGGSEVVECADDKEAVEKAMQLASGFDVEIWDHKRLVTPLLGIPPSKMLGLPRHTKTRIRIESLRTQVCVAGKRNF
jgi:hypothetical protein